jgi:hypothetical protein
MRADSGTLLAELAACGRYGFGRLQLRPDLLIKWGGLVGMLELRIGLSDRRLMELSHCPPGSWGIGFRGTDTPSGLGLGGDVEISQLLGFGYDRRFSNDWRFSHHQRFSNDRGFKRFWAHGTAGRRGMSGGNHRRPRFGRQRRLTGRDLLLLAGIMRRWSRVQQNAPARQAPIFFDVFLAFPHAGQEVDDQADRSDGQQRKHHQKTPGQFLRLLCLS